MQPLLERQFERLHEQLEQLREKVREQNAELQRSRKAKEDALETLLERQKEYNLLAAKEERYDALQSERDILGARQEAIRNHVSNLLIYTKALQEAFRR